MYRPRDFQEVSNTWLPPTNAYGGWYGRLASPGEVWLALVAERPNERKVSADWPPLYGGLTGRYLWRALAKAGVGLHHCYYSDVAKPAGKVYDLAAEIVGEVRPEKVIALGVVASQALWRADVSHYALPHPAYMKRWRAGDFDEYVSWLREIAH